MTSRTDPILDYANPKRRPRPPLTAARVFACLGCLYAGMSGGLMTVIALIALLDAGVRDLIFGIPTVAIGIAALYGSFRLGRFALFGPADWTDRFDPAR